MRGRNSMHRAGSRASMAAGMQALHRAGSLAGMAAALRAMGRPGYNLSIEDVPGNHLQYEIVEVNGPNGYEKWFDVWFDFPSQLAGNARDGWVDETLKIGIRLQRSEDLVTWDHEWIDLPSTVVADGFRYRARMLYPVSSQNYTLTLTAADTAGNALSYPFTALTLNSAAQSLPNFPYNMPTDAAQLQTDIRAAGWTGATVTASAATTWSIVIPNAVMSVYGAVNKIFWPSYVSGTGPLGDAYSDGVIFTGEAVNGGNVRTNVRAQFARLQITTRSLQ